MLALASTAPAVAQTQLYLLASGADEIIWDPDCQPWDYDPECGYTAIPHPGRVIQLDVDRRQIVATTPISHARGASIGPRTTPDGHFLLWSGSIVEAPAPYHVSLFDIARRQQATLFAASGLSSVPLTVHPSQMRAFLGLSTGGVTVAEPGTTYTLPSPRCAQPFLSGRSGDGRRLSYRCLDPQGVLVVDSADGHMIGTVPHAVTSPLLDDAGTTLFGASWHQQGIETPVFQRFDVATGALLAERQVIAGGLQRLTVDLQPGDRSPVRRKPRRHRRAGCQHPAGGGPDSFPHPSLPYGLMALDPDRPEAYIGWYGTIDNQNLVRVSLVHTGTFATIGSSDIPIVGAFVGMALGSRPPRVSDLGALVDGRVVTLSWAIDASRSIATEQVVEAGFAPGETAVRLPVAAGATSFAVAGVPPGRYFVRIRSVNGTGVGAPSNEVIVDVP